MKYHRTVIQAPIQSVGHSVKDFRSLCLERMDFPKKQNIKVHQQTKSLGEKVSTLETENAQLKTAIADMERQLQTVKYLHQSQVSQREAKLKSVSTCKVSSTQPSPSHTNIDPSRLVTAVRPTKPSTTTNPTTLPVVNPICRDQIYVSISPFTSSLMMSSAQPTSSLPLTLQTVSSEWTMYIPGAGKQTPTNFNLSHVQQDLMRGLTTHSRSKRRREEAEVATSSTSESNSKRKRVEPTSLAEGTSIINDPNSTYCTPSLVIHESISNLQAVPSEDLHPHSVIFSELSPNHAAEILLPDHSSSPPRPLLPPNFEHFGLDVLEQQVPDTLILINRNTQLGHTIHGHSSTGHSVPPDSSSIT